MEGDRFARMMLSLILVMVVLMAGMAALKAEPVSGAGDHPLGQVLSD